MGAWSAEPFGNDSALDWAFELEGSSDWDVVADALTEAANTDGRMDSDVATAAIAAAEVVARGLGRPTQDEDAPEDVLEFVARVATPTPELVELAMLGLNAASGPDSELSLLWNEDGEQSEWSQANARIATALRG